MKILVTGGAGFIGSHLCYRLLQEEHQVICLDRGIDPDIDYIANLRAFPRFAMIEHDVIDPIHLEVDQIYNLACPASPVQYQKDPVDTFKTAVFGTYHMLELSRKLGIPLLQASTSEIYGDPEEHPQNENYWGRVNPIGVRSCYNEGKRGAESLCMDFHRQYGLDVRIVRIFNCYGPHMKVNDGRVISNFIVRGLRDEDLVISGTGLQTRSFQYVDDLVEGMYRLMSLQQPYNRPLNLGNPQEISVLELANMIIALCKSSSRILFEAAVADDPKRRRPDITLAKKVLGWSPSVQIAEGLKRTIAYYQSHQEVVSGQRL